MRFKKSAAVLVFFAMWMTGCTSSTPAPSAPATSATAGMTEDEIYATSLVDCLAEAGWDVEYDPRDNSITQEGSAAQADAYDAAYEECAAPLRGEVQPLSDLSDEQWRSLYAQEVNTAECLRGLDLDVPEIPALQTFVDRYQTDDPWHAYGFAGSPSQSDWYRYLEECPQPTI
jgi:hypothetical protein